MIWRDGSVAVIHDGRPTAARPAPSLSDRAVVNALYSPMYEELIEGVHEPEWRAQATAHTIGAAGLLAAAIRLAR